MNTDRETPKLNQQQRDSASIAAPTFQNSVSRVWYLRSVDDVGEPIHEQRVEYFPGSPFPPTHYHPDQDEHFEVEQGEMLFVIDGTERAGCRRHDRDPGVDTAQGQERFKHGFCRRALGDTPRATNDRLLHDGGSAWRRHRAARLCPPRPRVPGRVRDHWVHRVACARGQQDRSHARPHTPTAHVVRDAVRPPYNPQRVH